MFLMCDASRSVKQISSRCVAPLVENAGRPSEVVVDVDLNRLGEMERRATSGCMEKSFYSLGYEERTT